MVLNGLVVGEGRDAPRQVVDEEAAAVDHAACSVEGVQEGAGSGCGGDRQDDRVSLTVVVADGRVVVLRAGGAVQTEFRWGVGGPGDATVAGGGVHERLVLILDAVVEVPVEVQSAAGDEREVVRLHQLPATVQLQFAGRVRVAVPREGVAERGAVLGERPRGRR